MDNNTYVSKVEENLKFIAESLKNMKVISYNGIVNLLKNKDSFYQIQFYDQYDIINDIHYSCVNILKDYDTWKTEEYKTIDQNVKDVYNNLIETIENDADIDPVFQIIIDYNNMPELICNVGDNILMFPKAIVKDLMACANEYPNNNPSDIYCIYRNKELFLPRSFEKDDKKEIVKTSK